MQLPEVFLDRMKDMLNQEEFDMFLDSFGQPRHYGLRANTLKISPDKLKELLPELGERVPWCKEGFYFDEGLYPGRLPLYLSGLYYIQEPSAMYPVSISGIKSGDKVLDLCASPGGKSIQAAGLLQNRGILVCNDANPSRISSLIKNIELFGVTNSVIFNKDAKELVPGFEDFFDCVIVDAPCSGEGMFRKDGSIAGSYASIPPAEYARIGSKILESAHLMLNGNGRIIYSTCTFNREENEDVIDRFLDSHYNYTVINDRKRIWPHKDKGEGHFVCVLKKNDDIINRSVMNKEECSMPCEFKRFCLENLNDFPKGEFFRKGSSLHFFPIQNHGISRSDHIKRGLYLGEIKNGRFDPSNPLILTLNAQDVKRTLDLGYKEIALDKYLKGETLLGEVGENGFLAVLCEGFTIGWAKRDGSIIKNHYPKTWRRSR
jgi:16S rRNA C967 or C1407 C5-methylase (RsmB/RsmF family)/NOL1/NOP2/fmu family ribosome biogenesis protein